MADVITRGTMLPPQVVSSMFNKVRGHSALANLCGDTPIPFNGVDVFTFSLDKEADIVAENGAKSKGGATVAPVRIVPIKFEYGTRVSDEFQYGSEEYRLSVLEQFAEGAAKKFARGMDLAAFHGVNPRTGSASAVVGNNHFDYAVSNIAAYTSAPDTNIESALGLIEANDAQANGIAMAPAMRTALAGMTVNGGRKYPEFAFGATPGTLGGMKIDVNGTVNRNSAVDMAILGDFQNAFKWGYGKNIPLEVIEYGNPDNDETLGDLKGHNQVFLRAEVYIGWGILAPEFFAIVRDVASLTLASAAGSASGKTAITVTETKGTNNIYKYYVGDTATTVVYGQDVSGGTTWDGSADITAATNKILTLVEATSTGKALKVGTVKVTAHA